MSHSLDKNIHAHRLFSVQKISSILRGEIPYKDMKQLIDEACTP